MFFSSDLTAPVSRSLTISQLIRNVRYAPICKQCAPSFFQRYLWQHADCFNLAISCFNANIKTTNTLEHRDPNLALSIGVPVSSVKHINFNLLDINKSCAFLFSSSCLFLRQEAVLAGGDGDLFSLRRMLHFWAFGFASLSEMSFCL